MICNAIQERIVVGEALDEASQTHVLACTSCGRLAAEWVELDSLVAEGIDGGVTVPDGFADGVMARLAAEPVIDSRFDSRFASRFELLLGRRWVQLALAQVGVAVAVANVLRFVFSMLVPAASLGGMR
jgi:hypothetical protein